MAGKNLRAYHQFCPVAKASEIFAERWTPLVLRELFCGSHRFNELRRGVPLMSQSMLSQRLKELEFAGLIERRHDPTKNHWEYHLTTAGEELRPVVEQLGVWGRRWVQRTISKDDLDAGLLMWDIHRRINISELPGTRTVVHFRFPDAPTPHRSYWLVLEPEGIDVCFNDPGFNIDLNLETKLITMTKIWLGDMTMDDALRKGILTLEGPRKLTRQFKKWLLLSDFATVKTQQRSAG